ncbi:hypothetical protein [Roseburia faecis]|jgi:hypothetical protein|uniref:hypothetical protein n=1 Tax=Roseburia faecis TaxID=301302 RepID=UPI0018972A9C|nr:hypothetical protein [Roseburia faecis]
MGITGLQTYDSSNAYNNAATGRKSSSDDKNATISDFIKKFGEARQITAQELKEDKDWRDMTDSEWGKLLSGFDKYIDTVKEQIKEMESMAIAKYQEAMAKYREEIKKNTSAEEDENHVLTKEEALQKLTESFEDHAKSLEGRTKQQDQSAQMLEDAIRRSSVWKNSSQRAQQFLAAQDKKKENPENLPEHFSENVIKAGAMFRDKFVKNGQENNVSIQNLLSDISLW